MPFETPHDGAGTVVTWPTTNTVYTVTNIVVSYADPAAEDEKINVAHLGQTAGETAKTLDLPLAGSASGDTGRTVQFDYVGKSIIEFAPDGDSAEVRTYLISQHIRESAPGPVKHYFLGGEYFDRVVRTTDGWRRSGRSAASSSTVTLRSSEFNLLLAFLAAPKRILSRDRLIELSRLYSDSEMVIWFAAGRGIGAVLRPLLRFSWPVLAVVALLAFVAWPWANQQTRDLKDRYGSRGDLERVAPGQFQESARGNRVFFLDKDTPDNKSGKNVFIASVEHGRETVTSARTGRIVVEGDSQFLLLSNGQRIERPVDGSTMKDLPPFERLAARTKSDWPPVPE